MKFWVLPRSDASTLAVLLWTVTLLLLVEIALQVRSHLRYGQSILNVATAETRYVRNESTGLKTLRPNQTFKGDRVSVTSNSLGLRSAEISFAKPDGTIRIAVVGASTVMGAYAATNDSTFPAYLQSMLRDQYPNRSIEVINAGIAGYALADQARILERLIIPLNPDLVLIYSGFNDITGYCKSADQSQSSGQQLSGLPRISTPDWLLTVELIKKNTVAFRTTSVQMAGSVNPDTLNLSEYGRNLSAMMVLPIQAGIPTVISTNTRAYRPEQPEEIQLRLSETARYFNSCFELADLHRLYDLHNQAIIDVAENLGVTVLPLAEFMPGGARYFVDSSHFTELGERTVAQYIFDFLLSERMLGLAP